MPVKRAGTSLALVAAMSFLPGPAVHGQALTGGDGLMYIGTYGSEIHVVSESDFSIVARIPATSGIPGGLTPSADGTRLFAQTIDYEYLEVFDLTSRTSINAFTLSQRNERVRIRSVAIHPDGRHVILMIRRYEKLRDRWDISDMELVLYDMDERRIVQDVPWPDGEPLENASFTYSPGGEHLYFFMDDVRIYDTSTYTQVDRWDYSGVLDQGLGDFRFGFGATPREEEGWHAGFFRIREEIQDRTVVGVARANPTERAVEFVMLGPADTGPSGSFALAPDRSRAYALHQEVGNYQLWSIDMETGSARHVVFEGRPRMSLEVSSNGRVLYIYTAGNTIDLYDAESLEYMRTVELEADMTIGRLWILPAP
ncbi:MAG: hypothetical protein LC667_08070 [Thioalkalivibrio sp.]|nr:hypothetical protein [Thioalkalivibrio sp.]